jgi:hypothetical protein
VPVMADICSRVFVFVAVFIRSPLDARVQADSASRSTPPIISAELEDVKARGRKAECVQ